MSFLIQKTTENGRKYWTAAPKKSVKSMVSGIFHKGAIG